MPNEKKKYIKMPPETTDGTAWCPMPIGPVRFGVENQADCISLGQSIMAWAYESASVGETIELEIIEMTDAEFEALPDI